MLAGVAYRKMRIKYSRIESIVPSPKGGALFIDDSIAPGAIYELVDPYLTIIIKRMLDTPLVVGPIVISVPVLIASYIVSRQRLKQLTILGLSLATDHIKSLAIKTAIRIVAGSAFFCVEIEFLSVISTAFGFILLSTVAYKIFTVDCDTLLLKVPMEHVSQGKSIGYIETPTEKSPKVFIKGSEETEIYIPDKNANAVCESRVDESKPQIRIHRTCEKDYVLFSNRLRN
jgi:hypothetical protein